MGTELVLIINGLLDQNQRSGKWNMLDRISHQDSRLLFNFIIRASQGCSIRICLVGFWQDT